MGNRSKSGRGPGRPRKNGLIHRALLVTSNALPDDLLEAMDLAMRLGLAGVADALRGAPDGDRAMVRRRALSLLAKVQDGALLAQASDLSDWAAVKDLESPPADPPGASLWLAALAVRVLIKLELGQITRRDDIAAHKFALREAIAVVGATPVQSRVEAARQLREERKIERERPGPATVQGRRGKAALRLMQ